MLGLLLFFRNPMFVFCKSLKLTNANKLSQLFEQNGSQITLNDINLNLQTMKIEIRLDEVVAFLKNYYNINLDLKTSEEGKVEVKYLITAYLSVKDLADDVVTISYKVNGVVDLLAKGANLFLGKKIEEMPFEWNPKTSEVIVNLREIDEFKRLLKYFQTTNISFVKDNIVALLTIRSSTD
jgi:hypothetical protein